MWDHRAVGPSGCGTIDTLPIRARHCYPEGGGVLCRSQSHTRLAPDLIVCFRESIKSKLNVTSPSGAVTYETHTCIHGTLPCQCYTLWDQGGYSSCSSSRDTTLASIEHIKNVLRKYHTVQQH
ncbi:hypothetical protein NQZ68_029461 [Dissostichus eleginoides]|nr:hypothetical protein NQZ68_029461 [Dissostichus eleginoides]